MTQWIAIDARGLGPPMPLIHILEAISAMPADSGATAHADRQSLLLLDELPQRGFAAECAPAPDGNGYVTTIQRA